MKIPFRLRKVAESAAATGLLLSSDDPADLLALLADLGADPLPPVFAVAGGYLVKLSGAVQRAFPGAMRLRRLADDLFLPVDAELLPTLFDDEAAGLVRERGLVFQPGGRVLGYDARRPLALAALLTIPGVRRRAWQPPPQPPERADRLRSLLYNRPQDTADAILIPDGPPIGIEEPRPSDAGFFSRTSGKIVAGTGLGIVWLGKLFGWKGLAKLGAGLVNSAVQWVPRLSESVLGRQEAALRELLRLFRSGKLDDALRRALPFGADGNRGGSAATDARLPTHNTNYSLDSLLGEGGAPSIWFGGGDVMTHLAREYRKAAEDAAERGDFRRAAFIYGKLLSDYSAAAAVLSRGGLHHDAAILYLEKLGDALTAAREFEVAGEFDRALKLYLQRGEHVAAGDLLWRLGEEEAAVIHYVHAADDLALVREDHLAAGELLLTKARRRGLALAYLQRGWAARPKVNALPCAVRLVQLVAEEETPRDLLLLADEAQWYFASFGADADAGQFFTELARVADRPNLVAVRDELRDRALCGLARKLRQRSATETRPGDLVSALVGRSGMWSPGVVSDADAAFRAAVLATKLHPETRQVRTCARIRLGEGTITAVCASPTGVVFVGFQAGALFAYDPPSGTVLQLPAARGIGANVLDVATTPGGKFVLILRGNPDLGADLTLSWLHCKGWQMGSISRLHPAATYLLSPVATERSEPVAGVWDGKDGRLYRGLTMAPGRSFEGSELGIDLETICDVLLVPRETTPSASPVPQPGATVIDTSASTPLPMEEYAIALIDDRDFWWQAPEDGSWHKTPLGWTVRPDAEGPRRQWTLLAREEEGWHVTVLRLGVGGRIYLARLRFVGNQWERVESAATGEAGYTAAAILGPRNFAGARGDRIDWLRIDGKQAHSLKTSETTPVLLERAVACFSSPLTAEVSVVLENGWLVRVPMPH